MYFNGSHTYYSSDGSQHAARAPYLILATDYENYDCAEPACSMAYAPHTHNRVAGLYACIRQVAMSQCGHFMMGSARVGPDRLILSGPYGSDGLPENYDRLSPGARSRFTRVPDAIAALYWYPASPGHNGSGSEARAMAAYARVLANPDRWPQDNPLIGAGSDSGWEHVFYKSLPAPDAEPWRWGPGSVPEPSDLTRNYSELLERFDGRRAWYSATGRFAQTNPERSVRATFNFGRMG